MHCNLAEKTSGRSQRYFFSGAAHQEAFPGFIHRKNYNFAHFWPFPDAGTVANSLDVTSAPCEPEILAHLSHLARPGSTARKLNSPPTVRQFATVCIIYGAPITLRHYIMDYFAN